MGCVVQREQKKIIHPSTSYINLFYVMAELLSEQVTSWLQSHTHDFRTAE